MYISKLSLVNYRNFKNEKFIFNKGINTVIGENGAGKSNLFRALRLLLDDAMLRYAYKLYENDFSRSLDCWKGHWIIISVEFSEISKDEAIQSLFLHGTGNIDNNEVEKATYNLIFRPKSEVRLLLSQLDKGDKEALTISQSNISIDDYEIVFTGKSTVDFNDEESYKRIVGDFENVEFTSDLDLLEIGVKVPHQLSVKNEISFSFIKALRDVVSDFQNNRTNPLLSLLKGKSENVNKETFTKITDQVKELNENIEKLEDITSLRDDVLKTIKETVGETYSPASLSIKSDLPEGAEKLLQSLKLFIGENEDGYEGGVHELSLGGANLVYLTLKLLEFKYRKKKESFANFLLIEEPEADIHTHIQKTLFDKVDYSETQVIYSTHSTHISEVSNLKNMNILSKEKSLCRSFQPSTNLKNEQVTHLSRYLDAVRSNLLFAKAIILVEGDAEEIILPLLLKKVLGVSFDELGISLINIRSTGFENVSCLFHKDRVKRKCAIVTDLDKSIMTGVAVDDEDEKLQKYVDKCARSEKAGKERKVRLDVHCKENSLLEVFYANHTFEVDFITSGNTSIVDRIVDEVYKDEPTKEKAKKELKSGVISEYGKRVLTMANSTGKGWFAILLGETIGVDNMIPKYLLDAIKFTSGHIKVETILDIIRYKTDNCSVEVKGSSEFGLLRNEIDKYYREQTDLTSLKKQFIKTFPNCSPSYFLGIL